MRVLLLSPQWFSVHVFVHMDYLVQTITVTNQVSLVVLYY